MGINIKATTSPVLGSGSSGFKAPQWEDAPTELSRRAVQMEIHGDTGTGRTTLALTAPPPIALIHFSEKIHGIVEPFARAGKEIKLLDVGQIFRGTPEEVAAHAMETWEMLSGAIYDAYTWARTVVLDTHTEGWELIRLAFFGALKPSGGRVDANYGPVNAEWRSLLKSSFRHQDKCHLVTIGQTKDEYKTSGMNTMGARTGRTIVAGQKEIRSFADVVVRTSRGEDGSFRSTIFKGWNNAKNEGLTLVNEASTFPNIMSLLTEPDETVVEMLRAGEIEAGSALMSAMESSWST